MNPFRGAVVSLFVNIVMMLTLVPLWFLVIIARVAGVLQPHQDRGSTTVPGIRHRDPAVAGSLRAGPMIRLP